MNRTERAEIAYKAYKESKKRVLNSQCPPPGIAKGKVYYPLTKLLLRLITLSEHAKIDYLNEKKSVVPKNRPAIFACTHMFKPDIEKTSISLPTPSCFIASDFKNSYKTIAGWYFNTRPTIFVDPYDKEDRANTYQLMKRYLLAGHNLMIYPEAVWNLSENRIVLNCFLGTVRAALETNAVVLCTAIERYGKKYIINRKGYLDFPKYVLDTYGKHYSDLHPDMQKSVLLECNRILRDTLATRKMEIWIDHAEKYGIEKRSELPHDYWPDFLNQLTSEWPGYKMSDNEDQQYYTKAEIEYAMVQQSFEKIQPSKDNAFWFNKRLKG